MLIFLKKINILRLRKVHSISENVLDVAKIDGLTQGRQGIFRGHKFMRYVTFVSGCGDASHDSNPVDLLGIVQLMASWNAAGMKVADPFMIGSDGCD